MHKKECWATIGCMNRSALNFNPHAMYDHEDLCEWCTMDSDCPEVTRPYCTWDACLECIEDGHCAENETCIAGECTPFPYMRVATVTMLVIFCSLIFTKILLPGPDTTLLITQLRKEMEKQKKDDPLLYEEKNSHLEKYNMQESAGVPRKRRIGGD